MGMGQKEFALVLGIERVFLKAEAVIGGGAGDIDGHGGGLSRVRTGAKPSA